jgi:hypothetical protein
MKFSSLATRKRLTRAAVTSYIEATHLAETGTAGSVQELRLLQDWVRNPRCTDAVVDIRRYAARIVTATSSHWVHLQLFRQGGQIREGRLYSTGNRPADAY